MAPPQWVHELAKAHLLPVAVFPCLELGQSIPSIQEAIRLGFLHDSAPTRELALEKALQVLKLYGSVPPIARTDAKRKARKSILVELTDPVLNEKSSRELLQSISGDEFQTTAGNILKSLKKKK